MTKTLAFFLFATLTAVVVRAAGPIDLGQSLSYFRVHTETSDEKQIGEALAANRALVLDLRYASATKADAGAFGQALAKRKGSEPLFVLVSPETPLSLAEALSVSPAKFVTLGVHGSLPTPAVVVEQSARDDHRAYEAFESGQPLPELISGRITKDRYDEASLMNDFRSGNLNAEPPAEPDPTATPDSQEKKIPPPLVDRVLQRAVNLHRALLALKPQGRA
jgi:hypothetical protein